MLECYRGHFGPVGLYWCVPMMVALLWPRIGGGAAVAQSAAMCPPNTPRQVVPPRVICAGLPAGCRVEYHLWPRSRWRMHRSLVTFVAFYQCHTLTGEAGSWQRQHGTRVDSYFPLTPETDELLVVTVGGVPVAVAGIQDNVAGVLYLSCLCAANRSTAGSLVIEHIKTRGQTIHAETTPEALGFYVRHGFVKADGGIMQWVPERPTKRAKTVTRP